MGRDGRKKLIRGLGVDLVEAERMAGAYARHGRRLVHRLCTPSETASVSREAHPPLKLASIFALKEAVMKALGTGMRGVGWKEIETGAGQAGPVESLLSGRALALARRRGVTRYSFSVTASAKLTIAAVLLSGHEEPGY